MRTDGRRQDGPRDLRRPGPRADRRPARRPRARAGGLRRGARAAPRSAGGRGRLRRLRRLRRDPAQDRRTAVPMPARCCRPSRASSARRPIARRRAAQRRARRSRAAGGPLGSRRGRAPGPRRRLHARALHVRGDERRTRRWTSTFTGTDAVFDVTLFDGEGSGTGPALRAGDGQLRALAARHGCAGRDARRRGARSRRRSRRAGGGAPASPGAGAHPGAGAPQPARAARAGRPAARVAASSRGSRASRSRPRGCGCAARAAAPGASRRPGRARGRLVVRSSVPKAGTRVSAATPVRLVLGAKPRGRR